jgi:hypothetical protein
VSAPASFRTPSPSRAERGIPNHARTALRSAAGGHASRRRPLPGASALRAMPRKRRPHGLGSVFKAKRLRTWSITWYEKRETQDETRVRLARPRAARARQGRAGCPAPRPVSRPTQGPRRSSRRRPWLERRKQTHRAPRHTRRADAPMRTVGLRPGTPKPASISCRLAERSGENAGNA